MLVPFQNALQISLMFTLVVRRLCSQALAGSQPRACSKSLFTS